MSDQVGEKRSLEDSHELAHEPSDMPVEKKAKLDDGPVPTSEEGNVGSAPVPPTNGLNHSTSETEAPPTSVKEDASPAHDATLFDDLAPTGALGDEEDTEDLESLQLSPRSLAQASSTVYDTTEEGEESVRPQEEGATVSSPAPIPTPAQPPTDNIPYPPGYDPHQVPTLLDPLQPVAVPTPGRRTRRSKKEQMMDAYPDPESKWCEAATERMIRLFAEFGKRHVLDEKMHNELKMCLDHGGNPAVLLSSRDGLSFFTYLTVAAECGDMELVKIFLTHYKDEFTEYDFQVSLEAALRKRQQEIADFILRNTPVTPTNEAVMEMCDVHMNDELKRKILPLQAFLDVCLGERFPVHDFYVPEILNRCIYAHNVAALQLLFERAEVHFLPLLTQATPESNIIRAGRGKSQDIGEGVPPLTYAAVMERTECLEVFLQHGADPNFVWNDMGGSLLHIAAHKGNMDMIELLVQAGADPRIPNDLGATVLSRTRGIKARKLITDTMIQLDEADGIIRPSVPSSLPPSSQGVGPMGYHPHAGGPPSMGMPMHLHSPGRVSPGGVNSYGNTPVVLPSDPTAGMSSSHSLGHGGLGGHDALHGHPHSLVHPHTHSHGHSHGHHLHHTGEAHEHEHDHSHHEHGDLGAHSHVDMVQPPPYEGHEDPALSGSHQPVDLMDIAHHAQSETGEPMLPSMGHLDHHDHHEHQGHLDHHNHQGHHEHQGHHDVSSHPVQEEDDPITLPPPSQEPSLHEHVAPPSSSAVSPPAPSSHEQGV